MNDLDFSEATRNQREREEAEEMCLRIMALNLLRSLLAVESTYVINGTTIEVASTDPL